MLPKDFMTILFICSGFFALNCEPRPTPERREPKVIQKPKIVNDKVYHGKWDCKGKCRFAEGFLIKKNGDYNSISIDLGPTAIVGKDYQIKCGQKRACKVLFNSSSKIFFRFQMLGRDKIKILSVNKHRQYSHQTELKGKYQDEPILDVGAVYLREP